MRLLWITSATAIVLSVLTARLTDLYLDQRFAILGSFAGLQRSHNPGIAFGVKLPAGIQELSIAVALLFVAYLAYRSSRSTLVQIGFGLVIGGGAGNIIDRLPDGLVTDLFQVGTFPIFNTADSCITIGVTLLLIDLLLERKHPA